MSALADSAKRLELAAETADDTETSRVLEQLDRDECRSKLLMAAVRAGLDSNDAGSGTLEAAIGNAWIQMEGALDRDAEVVAAVRREEDDLVDALARVLEIDLPSEVERAIRATVGRVAEDLERLDRLPHD
jgi:hypothetical protein